MNNNSKREINFFSRWHVARYPKATSTALELWKYADFFKPVLCPFLNHLINFWIVMRVFRAQLGLICVRQIQVWPYLLVQAIDEQCEFLDRMDFDAIFQQINIRYEWAIRVSAILTLNRMDVDMFFFHLITALPFPLQNLVQRLRSQTPSSVLPLRTFRQYLARPVLEKSRFFLLRWNFPPCGGNKQIRQ